MLKYIIVIGLGAIAGFFAVRKKTRKVNYHRLLDECIENERDLSNVFSKVLVLCKNNPEDVAIFAYQKYENGKVTKRKLTNDFDISCCPQDIQEKLDNSNEIVVYKF